ncbi:MAG TPA: hypothetical protein VL307_08830 [Chitinophagaceae bacterium]|nr:hypothetical protein [Chitinophagaceae bacterium]
MILYVLSIMHDGDIYEEDDATEVQQGLEAARNFLIKAVRKAFIGKTIAEIRAMIKDDPEDILEWLIEISLETESYEVCAAAQQLLNERLVTA